jgi:hypothetical protein
MYDVCPHSGSGLQLVQIAHLKQKPFAIACGSAVLPAWIYSSYILKDYRFSVLDGVLI